MVYRLDVELVKPVISEFCVFWTSERKYNGSEARIGSNSMTYEKTGNKPSFTNVVLLCSDCFPSDEMVSKEVVL